MRRKTKIITIINCIFSAIIWLYTLPMILPFANAGFFAISILQLLLFAYIILNLFTLIKSLECSVNENQDKYLKINVIAISITIILIITFVFANYSSISRVRDYYSTDYRADIV